MTVDTETLHKDLSLLPDEMVLTVVPHTYLTIAKERGGDVEKILSHAQLNVQGEEDLLAQERISAFDFYCLAASVIEFVGDDGIGLEVGFRHAPTAYGDFGYALLCSRTIRDVLDLCQRFWHLNTESMPLDVYMDQGECVMELKINSQIPEPQFHLTYESALATIVKCFQVLLGDQVQDMEVCIADDEPSYVIKARGLLGNVTYHKPAFQFRFPEKWLQRELPLYNPAGYQQAIQKCLKEEAFRKNTLGDLLSSKVRAQLKRTDNGYPNLEKVAESLHLTSRTLRRRLDKEGISFKVLLEEAKCQEAIRFLEQSDLDVQSIAERLGYSEHGNFSRAFKQWTGLTPRDFRRKQIRKELEPFGA